MLINLQSKKDIKVMIEKEVKQQLKPIINELEKVRRVIIDMEVINGKKRN